MVFRGPDDAFNAQCQPRAGSEHKGSSKHLGAWAGQVFRRLSGEIAHLSGTAMASGPPIRCQRNLGLMTNDLISAFSASTRIRSRTAA